MNNATYKRRQSQGLCVICGKIRADKDYATCTDCRTKQRISSQERRNFFKSLGICPRCGKNKLFGDERTCPECLATAAIVRKRSLSNLKKTDADYYREHQESLEAQGLCRTGCGRKRANGHTYCEVCLVKHRERSRKERQTKKNRHIERSERPNYGLCYTCGEPLDRNGRICKKCAERVTNNFHNKRNTEMWDADNKLIFKQN